MRLPGNLKPRMSMVSIADEEELVEIDEGSRTPPTPRKSTSLSESSTTALETATGFCWSWFQYVSNVCVCVRSCYFFLCGNVKLDMFQLERISWIFISLLLAADIRTISVI